MVQAVALQNLYEAFDAYEAGEGSDSDNLFEALSQYVAHQGMVCAEQQATLQSLAEKNVRVLKMTQDFCLQFSSDTEQAEEMQPMIEQAERHASVSQGIDHNFFETVSVKEELADESEEVIKTRAIFSALTSALKKRNATTIEAKLEELLAAQEQALPIINQGLDEVMAYLQSRT